MKNTPAGISATNYDEYANTYTKPWNKYLIDRIIEESLSIAQPVKKVLDVGTGTAHILIELANISSFNNSRLIGIDYFNDMVIAARNNVRLNGHELRIEIKKDDVHNLTFEDNYFDLIFGRSVIHHWENPITGYQEIYRVLAPNGVCIIHEPSSKPEPYALDQFNQLRNKFDSSAMSLSEKYTAEDVNEQIKKAGLEEYAKTFKGEGIASLGFELRITKKRK